MSSGIYSITCAANGKQYVGSAVNISSRWRIHQCLLRKGCHHSIKLQRVFNKYGAETFEYSVLEAVDDKTKLVEREQAHMDALKPWMNMNPRAGSALGNRWTDEQKRRASIAQKEASKTRVHPLKGTKGMMSPEVRAKISASLKGRIFPKGRKFTDEHRAKLSAAKTGKPPHNKGKPFSEESRARMSASAMGKKMPPRSEEYRKKISDHKKAYWAARKQA
jgi:predicted GIY-YIG superfamily endonuclease